LTGGEAMERMWSYLRKFGVMTKEMTSSHRIDILIDALIQYGKRSKEKLGMYSEFITYPA
jgi:hypothetical protein